MIPYLGLRLFVSGPFFVMSVKTFIENNIFLGIWFTIMAFGTLFYNYRTYYPDDEDDFGCLFIYAISVIMIAFSAHSWFITIWAILPLLAGTADM